MRKVFLLALLAFGLSVSSEAQLIRYYPPGISAGGSASNPFLAPDGTVSAPGFSFTSDPDTGMYLDAVATLRFSTASAARLQIQGSTVSIPQALGVFGIGNPADVLFTREGANIFQLGADAATATAQEFKGPDSTGAAVKGGNLTVSGGDGTSGNADGGNLILAGGVLAGSGDNGAVTIKDTGTKPTCDAGIRGAIWYDAGGAGVLDTLEVCRKDAGDAYAWVSLF